MYQNSEGHFFDKGSIDDKIEVIPQIFEGWSMNKNIK